MDFGLGRFKVEGLGINFKTFSWAWGFGIA